MSIQGIIIIDLLGVAFFLLLLHLVRTKKLYITYAVIWSIADLGMMLIVTIQPVLYLLPELVGAVYPASALSLLGFVFIFLVLIFMSVKLSILSARQIELIRLLALKEVSPRTIAPYPSSPAPTSNPERSGGGDRKPQ